MLKIHQTLLKFCHKCLVNSVVHLVQIQMEISFFEFLVVLRTIHPFHLDALFNHLSNIFIYNVFTTALTSDCLFHTFR